MFQASFSWIGTKPRALHTELDHTPIPKGPNYGDYCDPRKQFTVNPVIFGNAALMPRTGLFPDEGVGDAAAVVGGRGASVPG